MKPIVNYTKHLFTVFLILCFSVNSICNTTSFSLLSWNIENFGKTKVEELQSIVKVAKDFDIVAIQEVVAIDPGGVQMLAQLADELNRKGSKWDYVCSDPTSSPPYKTERYAFLWKTSKVKLKGRAWLDKEVASVIYREPFLARFVIEDRNVLIANYHSRKYNEEPEEEIRCFYNYPSRFPNDAIIIAGDFNTTTSNKAFAPLYAQGFLPNVRLKKTTLKRKCDAEGNYTKHAIDFILYESSRLKKIKAGLVDFVGSCSLLIERRQISDHLPVYLECVFNL